MYTLVSLTKNDALVAGNGSYIVRLSGPDLHGPTHTIEYIVYYSLLKLNDHLSSVASIRDSK